VTQDASAFFTIDRGSATVAAALVAPVDGRYRLLASAAAPAAVDPEAILEDLAWRVARTDATLAGPMDDWRDWSRLEVQSSRAPRAVLVAADAETGDLLERAFSGAGWRIDARFYDPAPELIALGEACLDPGVDAVVMGGREEVEEDDREEARALWSRLGSLARLRDDVAAIACGPFVERPEGIPDGRLFSLPAPDDVPMTTESVLRQAASQVGVHLVTAGQPVATDGRAAMRAAMASLAGLFGGRVDGIEVGVSATARTVAGADGELGHAVVAAAALLPPEALDDEDAVEEILRWSTLEGDPSTHLDALRGIMLRPWSGMHGDGARLRLAALRSSLERLGSAWGKAAEPELTASASVETVILSGGAFASVPPAAAALALIDGLRRPGAANLVHDHARVLAPLGALPVEADRRRLLDDLREDCLLPIGSVLLTGALADREARDTQLAIGSVLGDEQGPLEPDSLRLVDLPPGITARLRLEAADGLVMGQEGPTELEVDGGLGGLLVDTRSIPLELPSGSEQRRRQLASWEASTWAGVDA
jgi:hypothetical protein